MILLALIKIFDNIITTAKNIATYKEQKITSSILVFVSQILFYLVISKVITDNTFYSIIVVAVSAAIGNFIAFQINDKFKKDSKWTMVITSSDKEFLSKFCDYLKNQKIRYIVNDGYNRKWEKTFNLIVFSKTKDDSRKIDSYLSTSENRYLKEII